VMHSSYPEKKGVSYDLHVLQVIFNFYLSWYYELFSTLVEVKKLSITSTKM
jgi:hypothetical protein